MNTEKFSHSEQSNLPILAAVDGSASSYQAVAWAAAEAALHRRGLHIITSMAIPTGFGPGISLGEADLEWMRRDGERILSEATRVARTAAPGEELAISTEVSFEQDRRHRSGKRRSPPALERRTARAGTAAGCDPPRSAPGGISLPTGRDEDRDAAFLEHRLADRAEGRARDATAAPAAENDQLGVAGLL